MPRSPQGFKQFCPLPSWPLSRVFVPSPRILQQGPAEPVQDDGAMFAGISARMTAAKRIATRLEHDMAGVFVHTCLAATVRNARGQDD